MSQTLAEKKPPVDVAEIVRHGEKVVLPDGMSYDGAISLLMQRKKYEQQATVVSQTFNAFPWDGAAALARVLERKYGWAQAVPTPGFFGDTPPQMIAVENGWQTTIDVPWGTFKLPDIEGTIQTSFSREEGRILFALQANVLRLNEPKIREIYELVRVEVRDHSIYRGKAISIGFIDDAGDEIQLPTPKFLNTAAVDPDMLILSKDLEQAVETNLFTPITRPEDCLANNIPVKRGVLLGGTYGTGKTLIAHVASRKAVDAGVTFLYIKKAKELAKAIAFARQYQSPSCVIFCEDIDREMDGVRDEEMDSILNTIDGIDAKTSNIVVVLTTNHIGSIHQAMLRPGRLDAVIDVVPPDGPAITRLIKVYAKGALDPYEDLTEVGKVLAGNIPAVIAEVVKRAKLSQLAIQQAGTRVTKLTAQALLDAAKTIQAQVDLLKPKEAVKGPPLDTALAGVVRDALNGTIEQVRAIHDAKA